MFQDGINKVAMRIDEGQTSVGTDVGDSELLKKGRLAHASLADDRQVSSPIIGADAEDLMLLAKLHASKHGDAWFLTGKRDIHRRFQLATVRDSHGRGADGCRGWVPERCQFFAREEESPAHETTRFFLSPNSPMMELGHARHGELTKRRRHLAKHRLRLPSRSLRR